MGKIFTVGVGPGSPKYVTEIVKEIIQNSDIIAGYKYTLKTIEHLVVGKKIYEITMQNQEEIYQKIHAELGDGTLVVPFTGDVNFSESEVVDRLIEIFGKIEIIPGISSFQVAASRALVPLDKSKVITMHVTSSIEDKKLEMLQALENSSSVIIIPRPWPKQADKHFMPSEIAIYLKEQGFETDKLKVHVFESLTNSNETHFVGVVKDLEGKEFSDLSVMVIDQSSLDSYMNYKWQWES